MSSEHNNETRFFRHHVIQTNCLTAKLLSSALYFVSLFSRILSTNDSNNVQSVSSTSRWKHSGRSKTNSLVEGSKRLKHRSLNVSKLPIETYSDDTTQCDILSETLTLEISTSVLTRPLTLYMKD